jgi:hypothetical protein
MIGVLASTSAGFAALVAAVGGGLAGALGTGAYGQVRDRRKSKSEFKSATAPLRGEIAEARDISTQAFRQNDWPIGITPQWTESWIGHRMSVVSWLAPETYAAVSRAYIYMDQLQHSLKDGAGGRELEHNDRVFLLRGTKGPVGHEDPQSGEELTEDDRQSILGASAGADAETPPLDTAVEELDRRDQLREVPRRQ